MTKPKLAPGKRTRDEWRQLWLKRKAENPLLTVAGFARDMGVSTQAVSSHLGDLEEQNRETLSRWIADRIAACAKDHNLKACDVTWHMFREWARIAYGMNAEGLTSHHITMAGGFNRIRDSYFPVNPTSTQVEKRVIQTHALYNRRVGQTLADQKWLAESLEDFAKRVFEGRVSAPRPSRAGLKQAPKRIVNSVWSDLHFGADVKAAETGAFDYGKRAEARRMAHIVAEIADYKPQYRSDSSLRIWLLGDIMQGHLHPGDAAGHAEQMARCIHILVQALGYLAQCYGRVDVECVPGNHGRNKQKHHDRATDQKWDAHETVIYYAVKSALSKLQNVRVNIPLTPMVMAEAFGAGMMGTHFDTVMNVGFAGKNVPTGAILDQINQMNSDWADNARERGLEHVPCQVFVGGHTHSPLIHHTSGGRTLIVNGSLIPVDGFSTSMGRFAAANGQWVWEQVEGFPVGDARYVRVGFAQDEDEKLERIIKPWGGF